MKPHPAWLQELHMEYHIKLSMVLTHEDFFGLGFADAASKCSCVSCSILAIT